MPLHFDAGVGVILPQERGFIGIADQHGVRVGDQLACFQEQAEDFSPLKSGAGRAIELMVQRGGQIEQTAVDRNHKWQMSAASNRGCNPAEPSEGVCVNNSYMWLAPKCRQ